MLDQAKNTAAKYKWWIIGILLAIAILVGIWLSGRAAGKRNGINLSNPINDNGNGTDPSQGAFASVEEVRQLAGKLKADMTGFNIWGHDNDIYKTLLSYSDTDFIRVNNEFNTEYQKASEQTFRQWIEGETSAADFQWNPLRDSIIQRMDKLKII